MDNHIALIIKADQFKTELTETQITEGVKAFKGDVGKGLITQRVEFDPNLFTADKAKKWLKKNEITFSNFTEVEKQEAELKNLVYDPLLADWVEVEEEFSPLKSDEVLVGFGSEVKALGNGRVAGYLVTFSDEKTPDLSGDYFQKDTDFGSAKTSSTLYNHGMDMKIGDRKIGQATLKVDEIGVWIESQLEMRDEYEKAIYGLAEKSKLGWSSGTASHLVRRKKVGKAYKILSWPLGLDASLTPTPAEPRNNVVAIKSLQATEFHLEEGIPQSQETGDTNMETPSAAEGIKSAVEKVLAQQKAVQEAEVKKQKEQDEIAASIMEVVTAAMKSAPAVNKGGSYQGTPDIQIDARKNENKHFWGYLRNGDMQPYLKTAVSLNEGDNEQGLVLVPTDFYKRIVAKRDEISIARSAGATVINTSLKVVDIPIEGTREAKFVVPGEATAYDENAVEPFDKVTATILKYTRIVKVSEELIADQAADLESFLADRLGRTAGITENDIFLTGASTLGAVTSSGLGATAPSLSAISTSNILDLYYALSQPYREGAAWVMRGATEGYVRKLAVANQYAFVQTPQGQSGSTGFSWLVGPNNRVYNSDEMDAIGSAAKSILFANMNYYYIVERQGMAIRRLTERYADTGQIGILASFRVGGAVTQTEAFKHLLHPTTT